MDKKDLSTDEAQSEQTSATETVQTFNETVEKEPNLEKTKKKTTILEREKTIIHPTMTVSTSPTIGSKEKMKVKTGTETTSIKETKHLKTTKLTNEKLKREFGLTVMASEETEVETVPTTLVKSCRERIKVKTGNEATPIKETKHHVKTNEKEGAKLSLADPPWEHKVDEAYTDLIAEVQDAWETHLQKIREQLKKMIAQPSSKEATRN